MTRSPRIATVFLLTALVGACGGDAAPTTTTTTSTTTTSTTTTSTTTTTTTLPPTTTTTAGPETTVTTFPVGFASPLNGLSSEDTLRLDRSVIAIKIDNHPRARPQSGLLDADALVETLVEGGFTRFIAFFHDNESHFVGPIRSVRPTDSTIIPPTGAPLFMSGGQPWVQELTVARGVSLLGESAGMFRVSFRTAPNNLYGRTETLRARADARGYTGTPAAHFLEIDTWDYPDATATRIDLTWSGNTDVTWTYDPATRTYLREANGRSHNVMAEDGATSQIAVDVLVILVGDLYTATGDGNPVPAIDTVGSGHAWVFARGRMWEGTWERTSISEPFHLTSPDGSAAVVPAGLSWTSVFPDTGTVSVSE